MSIDGSKLTYLCCNTTIKLQSFQSLLRSERMRAEQAAHLKERNIGIRLILMCFKVSDEGAKADLTKNDIPVDSITEVEDRSGAVRGEAEAGIVVRRGVRNNNEGQQTSIEQE